MARFGFLSTFPPTRCGLATFTDALSKAMTRPSDQSFVVRVVDEFSPPTPWSKPSIVAADLHQRDRRSLAAGVRILNTADIAVIQHEYGIYGGPDGDEILAILDQLTVPSIVVFHTAIPLPTPHQKWVLEEVARRASAAVVMTESARDMLDRNYSVNAAQFQVIPHGVAPFSPMEAPRRSQRPVVLTWGLIGPGKGIEWAVEAFAKLRTVKPRPVYRVLGQTHPKVLANHGDAYRDSLLARVRSLKLNGMVDIDNRYMTLDQLGQTIMSADIVLLPYDSQFQVTSGVLAEAVAAGKPVVATDFPHAVELLESSGAGIVVPHKDPTAIAEALRHILGHREVYSRMARSALDLGKDMLWPSVGAQFRALAMRLDSRVAA